MQATDNVPLPHDENARQDNGALRARVYGNVFDGAEVVFTWPAAMGPVTYPHQVQQLLDGKDGNDSPMGGTASFRRLQQYPSDSSAAEAAWPAASHGLNVTVVSSNVTSFTVRIQCSRFLAVTSSLPCGPLTCSEPRPPVVV